VLGIAWTKENSIVSGWVEVQTKSAFIIDMMTIIVHVMISFSYKEPNHAIRLPEILRSEEIHTVPEPLDEVVVFTVEGSPVWVPVVVAPPIVQHWPVGFTEPELEELDWIGDVGVIG
jgi:hypothetical protein